MNLEHSIKEGNHERYSVHLQCLRNVKKIKYPDFQAMTFKWIRINWSNINVTGISGTRINMPDMAYVSIFMDNDLTRITEDHFEIKLIARLLDQMYVIEPPVFTLRYDDALPSAPQFPEHLHSLLTHS